jgi:hypothetical protein
MIKFVHDLIYLYNYYDLIFCVKCNFTFNLEFNGYDIISV